MKTWKAGVLGLALAVSFSGCGGDTAETPEPAEGPAPINLENLDQLKEAPEVVAPADENAADAVAPEDASAPSPEGVVPMPPAPAGDDAAAAPGAAAAVPGEQDPQHAMLIGTTWVLGDTEVTFRDGDTVFVKGGQVMMIAPDGLEAEYTYTNGKIDITAVGQTKSGTWDGTTLVIDGTTATKK